MFLGAFFPWKKFKDVNQSNILCLRRMKIITLVINHSEIREELSLPMVLGQILFPWNWEKDTLCLFSIFLTYESVSLGVLHYLFELLH